MATQIRTWTKVTHREHKFGCNASVGTSAETIWTTGGLFPWSTTWDQGAAPVIVRSTSAQDSGQISGTGIQRLTIAGLGGDGQPKSTTVTLSGTYSVAIGTWSMIWRMNGEEAGSSSTNVGTIAALYNSTITIATIEAGAGQTEMAVYRIPLNMSGCLTAMFCSAARGDSATAQIFTRSAVGKTWRLRSTFSVPRGGETHRDYPEYVIHLSPGTWIDMRAFGGNFFGSRVDGGFDLVLTTDGV